MDEVLETYSASSPAVCWLGKWQPLMVFALGSQCQVLTGDAGWNLSPPKGLLSNRRGLQANGPRRGSSSCTGRDEDVLDAIDCRREGFPGDQSVKVVEIEAMLAVSEGFATMYPLPRDRLPPVGTAAKQNPPPFEAGPGHASHTPYPPLARGARRIDSDGVRSAFTAAARHVRPPSGPPTRGADASFPAYRSPPD